MKAKRVIAMMLSLSLTASMVACSMAEKNGAELTEEEKIEERGEEAKLVDLMGQEAGSHSGTSGKDEVVDVIMDADGENGNVIVSDQLKNCGGK